ncbi:endonuclease III [Porphyromonas endodontalis]|uniref:endonuclease III n=1 Tax=Porphyromonas endodontalis TaxID=28124 RepID=UPI003F9F1794
MTKKERFEGILAWFGENMPVAETELHYRSPYELLVAVILSAQCTDKRVNMVTPALFDALPTVEAMAQASQEEILALIKSISYPNSKAEHLSKMAQRVVQTFGGSIPASREELMTLPGVGRKTANVILAVLYNQPTMAVDTHVFRVSERIGLTTRAKTPLDTELTLVRYIPPELIPKAHHWLILHGRYVCLARSPKCTSCGITPWCRYAQKNNLTTNK